MKKIIYLFVLIACSISMQAQNNKSPILIDSNVIISATSNGISKFSINKPTPADSVFSLYGAALGLTAKNEMKPTQSSNDETGYTHQRYQQFYQGYAVAGAEYIIHSKNKIALTGNGKIVALSANQAAVSMSKEAAIQKAMSYFKAAKYAWQIPQLEADLKESKHNKAATWYPSPTLQWTANPNQPNAPYQLAYVIELCDEHLHAKKMFINAGTGALIYEIQLHKNCFSASVNTNFNGLQNIFTFYLGPAGFVMWDQCQAAFIRVRQWANPISGATEFNSANNTWASNSSAATSLWTVKKAFQYFSDIHVRNGWNGAGAGINVYHNALFCFTNGCTPNDANNATFYNGTLQVGNSGTANNIDDWNTIDISAHEFAHGVTESSASLVYANESGALNESFSDIFGVNCYQWFNPAKDSLWFVGFDRKNPLNPSRSLYIRNMSNPNDKADPDTYKGDFWYTGTEDNGGVHWNSGVQNYMYYLLVNGGSGVNDNDAPFQVTGLGFEKARRIAYHTLNNYLISSSGFVAARNAWVRAAAQLYGECSFEAIQTGKAWAAVGLEPPVATTFYYCGNYGNTNHTNYTTGPTYLSNGCLTTINPTGNLVQFGSGTRVTMGPGFNAVAGSRFNAIVNQCGMAYYQ